MIFSMTAFAREQSQSDLGHFICEMRSINHRYLEVGVHLPEALRPLEMAIRERIRKTIKRGKIECNMRYQPNAQAVGKLFTINTILAKELCKASEQISGLLKEAALIDPTEILRFPGVMEMQERDASLLQPQALALLEKTLVELVAARGREGKELQQHFLKRIETMRLELNKIRERLPNAVNDQQARLMKRFTDAKIELDPNRLEQEMVMFAQKIDVAEEIDRTETHIIEIHRILNEGGAVGRRLDFLLQELNRESNTIASKSVDPIITHAAVEMKVLIEQIREQMQNIE